MNMRSKLMSVAIVVIAASTILQIGDYPIHLPVVFSQTEKNSGQEMYKAYISECQTTHVYTKFFDGNVGNGEELVYSNSSSGDVLPDLDTDPWAITIAYHPVEGNWWVWRRNSSGERISEFLEVHTDKDLGLYKCQYVTVAFYK